MNDQQKDQQRRHELREHRRIADPRLACLGARKALAKAEQAVNQRRHQEHRHLNQPVNLPERHPAIDRPAVHQVRHQASRDEAAGPTGVQDIEVVRLLFREKTGNHRVDDRFASSVRDGEQEHGDVERPVDAVTTELRVDRIGRQLQASRDQMGDKGQNHQRAITDLVGQQRADEDDDAEAGEAATGDAAELGLGESIVGGPIAEDAGADRETDAGREDGEEAGPQQPLLVMRLVVLHGNSRRVGSRSPGRVQVRERDGSQEFLEGSRVSDGPLPVNGSLPADGEKLSSDRSVPVE